MGPVILAFSQVGVLPNSTWLWQFFTLADTLSGYAYLFRLMVVRCARHEKPDWGCSKNNTVYSASPDLVWAAPDRCLVEIEPILDFQMKE